MVEGLWRIEYWGLRGMTVQDWRGRRGRDLGLLKGVGRGGRGGGNLRLDKKALKALK